MSPVIDVHTHMLTKEWLSLLEQHGRPRYTLEEVRGGLKAIHLDGARSVKNQWIAAKLPSPTSAIPPIAATTTTTPLPALALRLIAATISAPIPTESN